MVRYSIARHTADIAVVKLCVGLVMVLVALTAPAAAVSDELIGDWSLICEPQSSPSPKTCAISQSVVDRSADLSVTVILGFDPMSAAFLRIIAPPSIELSRGIIVSGNGEQLLTLKVRRCNNLGCIAEHTLSPGELISIADRPIGAIVVHANETDGFSLPVDFSKLGEALERLGKRTGIRYAIKSPDSRRPEAIRVVFKGVRRTAAGAAPVCVSEANIRTVVILQLDSERELDAKLENVRGCYGSAEQVAYIDGNSQHDADYGVEEAVATYLYKKGVGTIRLGRDGSYETFIAGR